MNERIKLLALQAGLQPFEDCGPGYVYKMEKFAELIVRECYNVAEEHDYNLSGNGGEILTHFGVDNHRVNIIAGAELHADKGYRESTAEEVEAFARRRNERSN